MEPGRCGAGIFAVSLILLVFALIFGDISALVLGILLLFFLLYRASLFLYAVKKSVSNIRIQRSVSPALCKQGATVQVATVLDINLDPGLVAEAADIPPHGAIVVHGTGKTGPFSSRDRSPHIRYRISCAATGDQYFSGTDISFRDPFFSLCIPLRGHEYRQPVLRVEPLGRYIYRGGKLGYGEREREIITPIRGSGIRSFRAYVTGDDPRAIDWKLSAKHAKLFVREYLGLLGKHALIVVDLPDGAVPSPAGEGDKLRGAALHSIRQMIREPDGCSLMIISGANLLAFLPDERSLSLMERTLMEIHTPPRLLQCFRILDPGTGEAFRQRLRADPEDEFNAKLSRILGSFLSAINPLPFEVQCMHALSRRKGTVLHVLSTGNGDQSHLAILGLLSRKLGIEAYLGIPGETAEPTLLSRVKGMGFSDVRVIR